uniref:Uncharacterized protein n=1 Tax=Medicago truncatula TaxID=3880 RepID=Q2HS31_MEDTR|nr:hypothetical protein MtrDRAFT_AC157503g18v2 [Medicago truncatula]
MTRAGSGRRCTRHDNERLLTASRGTESHRNERVLEAVQWLEAFSISGGSQGSNWSGSLNRYGQENLTNQGT